MASCAIPPKALLYQSRVSVTGQVSAELRIRVPATTPILITASPAGIDVQLKTVEQPAATGESADNPVRRFGPRRLILDTGDRTEVSFRLVRKENGGTHGTVHLEVVPLAALSNSACAAAYRLMAQGDLHYARAQATPDPKEATRVDEKVEYAAAARSYADAAGQLAAANNPDPVLAQAELSAAATHYQNLQQWPEAADLATRARTTYTALGEDYGAARAGAMKAAADMELALVPPGAGRTTSVPKPLFAVRQVFMSLSQLHARRGEDYDAALALNNAGLASYYAGDFDRAIELYQQALPLYVRLQETLRQAQVLQNIALTEYELGRFSVSKRDFARAIGLLDPDSTALLRGEILNNEALAEYASADLDASFKHHCEALAVFAHSQSEREQARSLNGIGTVYYAVGDKSQALEYFSRALAMRDAKRDPRGRMASLRAMASVLSDLHRIPEAIGLRREALELAVAPSVRARIESQLARDLQTTGDKTQARMIVDHAVDEPGSGRSIHALALLTRADLEYEDAALADAERDASQALLLLKDSEDPTEQFTAWVLSARIARARNAPQAAQTRLDRALGLAEQVRLQSANPELRAGLWQSIQPVFDLKIELLERRAAASPQRPLLSSRPLALATLATAELSRARSLADYWRLHDVVTGQSTPATRQLRELYREIADRRFELEVRLDRNGESDPRNRAIRADITALRREIDSKHRITPRTNSFQTREPRVGAELTKIIETIPPDTAVIEYWLGTQSARAWVVTKQGVRMIGLGPSDRLDQAARAVHASLRDFASISQTERTRKLAELSALVIRPLPPDILQHHSLVIIPDGALHYVPFSVLVAQAGDAAPRPLVADHVLTTAPSLESAGWKVAAVSTSRRALIVADPVYSATDTRLPPTRPGRATAQSRESTDTSDESAAENATAPRLRTRSLQRGFERLPATAAEANSIQTLFSPTDVDSLRGFDASRAAFLGRDLSQYNIIHIAAHGVTNTEAPQLSALVLSLRDPHGAPVPGEVFAGEFLLTSLNADLVVLSACDTALGRETAGEGLLGLRYAVHAAGARSVIASLWEVPDRVAASLMVAFYSHYVRQHERPAEALAEALRETQHTYDDPGLWGAFELSAVGRDALFATTQHNNGELQ